MTTGSLAGWSSEVVVVVHVPARADHFLPTLNTLADHADFPVILGARDLDLLDRFSSLGLEHTQAASLAELVNRTWERQRTNILAISDAVLIPPDFLAPAVDIVRENLRVATVSFLSNAAGFLSFPFRNTPRERVVDGRDEQLITRTLRQATPAPVPAPIPFASGAATLIASPALSAIGPFQTAPSGQWAGSLADFCLRGRSRGFVDLADLGTFYARPSDLAVADLGELLQADLAPEDLVWLQQAHPFVATFLEDQKASVESPLALEYSCARSKVLGLRVALDATCLGPSEMGTQVTTLAIIQALAERADIAQLGVLVSGQLGPQTRQALAHPKITVEYSPEGNPEVLGPADVAHRPFQPDVYFDIERWRRVADRVLVSVLDLISYQIGHYHGTDAAWLEHRRNMQSTLAQADGIVAISQDVQEQIALERLPINPGRLFVVHPGTDHLRGDEPAQIPQELVARGFVAGDFLLTLGTTYSHKNRDIAIRTHHELLRRGVDLPLVMAGPAVPFGSSRVRESQRWDSESKVWVIPNVSSQERNWLIRHASLVLYPTSAEGFGFVAHEAAHFGTPTTYVSFGPLKEMGGSPPVTASDWDPRSLADAAERLLSDPALAEKQVIAALAAGEDYTWELAADKLVGIYRSLLARPSATAASQIDIAPSHDRK